MFLTYANNKVKFGSQPLCSQWKLRQERLSPRCSTHINDIIQVKMKLYSFNIKCYPYTVFRNILLIESNTFSA
ncbi:DUF4113 domain-containing protein [uncultured Formosa sp.]|uniref:DUF4113 domain-containing protein n=1 Tax=uncultured Formosa sp. TaxID=255435 RepID=UPI00261B8713|nr:DUF4113 domain-containing protein [uncultured Formosa sp.]